ncbi:MAG: TolC family protein [Pseudomonadota bacterium]
MRRKTLLATFVSPLSLLIGTEVSATVNSESDDEICAADQSDTSSTDSNATIELDRDEIIFVGERALQEAGCPTDNHDFIGASKIRTGEYEFLNKPETTISDRLERKRALITNRFRNGTKTWDQESDQFSQQLQNKENFEVSEAYESELTSIGAGKGRELVSRYKLDQQVKKLTSPPLASSETEASGDSTSSGVLSVKRASLTDPSSPEGMGSIATSVAANIDDIDVFRGTNVGTSLGVGDAQVPLMLDDALSQAAIHAPQIAVFRELPAIRETSVQEAKGRFKPEVFAEARYEDRDIPTTSLAQTAGDDRLREDDFATEFGIRKRVRSGAELTLSQRFSSLETNLIEFNPAEQSRSRTVLSVRQPILRGAGFSFNRALDNVAKLETDVAVQEFRRQSENHLLEVTRAYWNLYLARAVAIAETQSVQRIDKIVSRIEARRNIDARRLQVTRARAARAEQRSSLVRARNAVRNAEARLRALIGSPDRQLSQANEIVPQDIPTVVWKNLQVETALDDAKQARPEIKQAKFQHKASIIRKGIAANEALPQLDLIVEGSINGREDNFNFGGAFNDANEGDYLVGLRFSMPIGRDERKSRHKRRRLEELQQRRQIETTLNSLQLETEISVNEYAVAYEEFLQRKDALELAEQDYEILQERWQRGVGNDGVVFMDMLVDANRRLLSAQGELNEAIVTFKYAEANLERSRGQYLQNLGYRIKRTVSDNGTPGYTLERTR